MNQAKTRPEPLRAGRLLCAAALVFYAGCTFDQPARYTQTQWSEFHRQVRDRVVTDHEAPATGRCAAAIEPVNATAPGSDGADSQDRLREFDKLWRPDQPWPPVGDFASQVGTLDDFLIELGYAYLTDRNANPRRAYVVFAEHGHRFPAKERSVVGRAHAHLTVGDLSSAEQTLAELKGVARADLRDAGAGRRGADAEDPGFPVEGRPAATLPAAGFQAEVDFLRWLISYQNCRPSPDGSVCERGPERKGAEDLAGAPHLVNFVGMEQLKEPPRPGPLSYVGFILTPVTFFGERVVDLVQRDDAARLPRWEDLATLPGRSAPALPQPWFVADFMRSQAPVTATTGARWEDRGARFLACSVKPRWAGQWLPRLHDAPDLGYFPHFGDLYAVIGRLCLAQGPTGSRPTVEDVCDALVSLLVASYQEPGDPVVASELAWLWYQATQRDDPMIERRQPFLAAAHRFGEFATLYGTDLLLQGSPVRASDGARISELRASLQRAGALAPMAPFQDDGPLAIAGFRLLAATLAQLGPEVRRERTDDPMLRRAQELVKWMVQPHLRGDRGGDRFAVGGSVGPWHMTPRGGPGEAAARLQAKAPLEPWFAPVFDEYRWLLESWLGAIETESRDDPATLARGALVRDRLWRGIHEGD